MQTVVGWNNVFVCGKLGNNVERSVWCYKLLFVFFKDDAKTTWANYYTVTEFFNKSTNHYRWVAICGKQQIIVWRVGPGGVHGVDLQFSEGHGFRWHKHQLEAGSQNGLLSTYRNRAESCTPNHIWDKISLQGSLIPRAHTTTSVSLTFGSKGIIRNLKAGTTKTYSVKPLSNYLCCLSVCYTWRIFTACPTNWYVQMDTPCPSFPPLWQMRTSSQSKMKARRCNWLQIVSVQPSSSRAVRSLRSAPSSPFYSNSSSGTAPT